LKAAAGWLIGMNICTDGKHLYVVHTCIQVTACIASSDLPAMRARIALIPIPLELSMKLVQPKYPPCYLKSKWMSATRRALFGCPSFILQLRVPRGRFVRCIRGVQREGRMRCIGSFEKLALRRSRMIPFVIYMISRSTVKCVVDGSLQRGLSVRRTASTPKTTPSELSRGSDKTLSGSDN
jgi:hypothetical protein